MVTDQNVGSCVYYLMSLITLTQNGLMGVFTAPMKRNNDDCGGVCLAQAEDTLQKRIHWFLTDARLVRQVSIVLKGEAQ